MKFNKIIVSKNAFDSIEPYDLINSNLTVINLLREHGVDESNLNEDAFISYCVDFYLAQYSNGNFSQFVWNTRWSKELNNFIEKGLEKIGAKKHLELFKVQSKKVKNLSQEELNLFFESGYFGTNATRDKLKNNEFYNIEEDIIELNSNWLRTHPQLVVCSIEDIYNEIENYLGHTVERVYLF